jgi:hypothetical protein
LSAPKGDVRKALSNFIPKKNRNPMKPPAEMNPDKNNSLLKVPSDRRRSKNKNG